MPQTTFRPSAPGPVLRTAIWIAQLLLFAAFTAAGYMKLTTPIPQLSAMMPWTGQLPEPFVRAIALVDLAGGLGILLPAVTRILPRLGVLAALGIVVLQALAALFHGFRGEFMMLPFNALLFALGLFVLWGRGRKAPIRPRGHRAEGLREGGA